MSEESVSLNFRSFIVSYSDNDLAGTLIVKNRIQSNEARSIGRMIKKRKIRKYRKCSNEKCNKKLEFSCCFNEALRINISLKQFKAIWMYDSIFFLYCYDCNEFLRKNQNFFNFKNIN